MDEQYIRAHDVVGRYLLRQLSEQEQYDFEQYYFEHPEILDELVLERELRDGLLESHELRAEFAKRETRTKRVLAAVATPMWSLTATAAACVLAAMLVLPRASVRAPAMSPIVGDLELVRTRGATAVSPTLHIEGDGVVSLSVDAAGFDRATLNARLSGPGRREETLPLQPDQEFGLARLVVPASSLQTGSYELKLRDASGQQLTYGFQITR